MISEQHHNELMLSNNEQLRDKAAAARERCRQLVSQTLAPGRKQHPPAPGRKQQPPKKRAAERKYCGSGERKSKEPLQPLSLMQKAAADRDKLRRLRSQNSDLDIKQWTAQVQLPVRSPRFSPAHSSVRLNPPRSGLASFGTLSQTPLPVTSA